MSRYLAILIGLVAILPLQPARSESADSVEAKLREALRTTMLQLRDAQGQIATMQTTQVENEQKIKDLTASVETLTRQSAEDKQASDKAIALLDARVADQDTKLASYIEALAKWKKAYQQAADLARSKEAARAKLESEAIVLQRRVEDQKRKNEGMYQIGTEVLNRYRKFALGDAITAREPFVGLSRVKLENLMQEYRDKLDEQLIRQP